MTGPAAYPRDALIVLGCPEVPVQQALALYVVSGLRDRKADVIVTGNPSVLGLLKVSDPKGVYLQKTLVLETCIGELAEKKRNCDTCIVFAHNDAAIAYAATLRHLLPKSRFVVVIFGKDPEPLAAEINFSCEKIVEKAVHNPAQLKAKINQVLGWAASSP